ncbi:MAG TPA: envelope integrity protein Cei [Actinophytocola sp.]|uniref:envelope integrity protein Cei n=1 Tax=Actinophytocola sp. TaxID=1872138 RepID=UPI002DBDFE25|nr:envelope integrity protein Cei [Actinophytocola sp.]HEU5469890.1 envelope integrity protein Cei [Actinophytocola sp.]
MGAGNVTWGGQSPNYRRHRPVPALVLILVLGIAATIVWIRVLGSGAPAANSTSCAPPSGPPVTVEGQPPTTLGQALDLDALDRTPPAPPALSQIRVVNASTRKGQAAEVTEALRQIGFGQIAPPDNDPLYSGFDLNCRAQIRFGQQGTSAARTLSLVEPCAQLVRDDRQDATVDLALGKLFDDIRPRSDTRRVLEELNNWAVTHPEIQGGLQSDPSAQPDIEPSRLASAREVTC